MPDTREKLIELLGTDTCKHGCCEDCEYGENRDACIDFLKESMADHLIANGVTVQEWIPVTERLPKAGKDVLVVVHDGYDSWVDTDEVLKDGRWLYFRNDRIVTHWMPLPEPPKEE